MVASAGAGTGDDDEKGADKNEGKDERKMFK